MTPDRMHNVIYYKGAVLKLSERIFKILLKLISRMLPRFFIEKEARRFELDGDPMKCIVSKWYFHLIMNAKYK